MSNPGPGSEDPSDTEVPPSPRTANPRPPGESTRPNFGQPGRLTESPSEQPAEAVEASPNEGSPNESKPSEAPTPLPVPLPVSDALPVGDAPSASTEGEGGGHTPASAEEPTEPSSSGEESSTPGDRAAASPQPEAAAPTPSRSPGTPRVMAVANQKGGVGKTTTAVNFGAAAAELGHRVLIVDLDPQGNASTGLGINPRSLNASMYDVLLHDVPIDEAIEAAEVRNLFVAPANLDLAGAEIELVPAFSRELRLKNALATVADDFDLVLIDCPPSLGLLTVNAFAAATEVMVPIQCEYYALEGLGQLLRNVDLVKRNLNASLELSAIVLVMYDARTNLASQVAGEVREHFGSKVCRAVIPRNIRLSEAPSFGQPITVFDPSSRGAIAYRDLAKEVAGEPA